MTQGLLISRKTKIGLHKLAVKERTKLTSDNYKKYRNIFNQLVQASKKLYFNNNFEKHKKILKKPGNYRRKLHTSKSQMIR